MLSSEACHCIYITGQDGWLRALDVTDGYELHSVEILAANGMAITGGGKILAIGHLTGETELFDAFTMRQLARLPTHRVQKTHRYATL
jgi:hypothetical protein